MTRQVRRQSGGSDLNSLLDGVLVPADFKGAKVANIRATDLPPTSGDRGEIARALSGCVACASEALTPSDSIMLRTLNKGGHAVVMIASSAAVPEDKLAESRMLIEKNGGSPTLETPRDDAFPQTRSIIEVVLPSKTK